MNLSFTGYGARVNLGREALVIVAGAFLEWMPDDPHCCVIIMGYATENGIANDDESRGVSA